MGKDDIRNEDILLEKEPEETVPESIDPEEAAFSDADDIEETGTEEAVFSDADDIEETEPEEAGTEKDVTEEPGNTRTGKNNTLKKKKSSSSDNTDHNKEDNKKLMFRVVTKRDEEVLKAFITFNYRVVHPKVFLRSILYSIVFLSFGFVSGASWFGVLCDAIGLFLLFVALFRKHISLMMTKRDDEDYKSGATFTYNFTGAGAQLLRNKETLVTIKSLRKSITTFFSDQGFYYLGFSTGDLFILPKDKFVVGSASDFEEFIRSKTGKSSRWIPYGIQGIMYNLSNFSKQPMIDTEGWKDLAKSGKDKIAASREKQKEQQKEQQKKDSQTAVKKPKQLKKDNKNNGE